MNIIQFISAVDSRAEKLPREDLLLFLHNYAQRLPEADRDDFLEALKELVPGAQREDAEQTFSEELSGELAAAAERLELIGDGELCLEGCYNDCYDDWYASDGEEILYEDPENICGFLENSCRLAHTLTDRELYREAYELSDKLLSVCVEVDSEDELEPLCLSELCDGGLVSVDCNEFLNEAVYAAYNANPLRELPNIIFRFIALSHCSAGGIKPLMQRSGNQPERFSEFLRLWLNCLAQQSGRMVNRLLPEAVSLSEDYGFLRGLAAEYAETHPLLYVYLSELEHLRTNAALGLETGMEALEKIPSDYTARAAAALLTADCALRLNRPDTAELCWLEAFRSDTSVVNYLRLFTESRRFSDYRSEARAIYNELHERADEIAKSPYHSGEPHRNCLHPNTYYTLLFFEGEFSRVINESMNIKTGLGWFSTFTKTGIALFLLLTNEEAEFSAGCRRMLRSIVYETSFDKNEYMKGTLCERDIGSDELFTECFLYWRAGHTLPHEEAEKIIGRLRELISLRTRAIIEENRRGDYGECAAFVAALGETLESRGSSNAAQRLMLEYKAEYPRRIAFHKELRAFGMKK